MVRVLQTLAVTMALVCASGAWAQGAPGGGGGDYSARGGVHPVRLAAPSAVVGETLEPSGVYEEYYAHSAHVKRSYAPGYTPHITSQFLNPRTYPDVKCVMGTPYYQYGSRAGWHFTSPQGHHTGAPPESEAVMYLRGELGITDYLNRGYPRGQRVIEPVLVPVESSMKKGGILITAPSAPLRTGEAPDCECRGCGRPIQTGDYCGDCLRPIPRLPTIEK